MSRAIIYKENGDIEKEIIWNLTECEWKLNGICSNNKCKKMLRYGKKCYVEDCGSKKEESGKKESRSQIIKFLWKEGIR